MTTVPRFPVSGCSNHFQHYMEPPLHAGARAVYTEGIIRDIDPGSQPSIARPALFHAPSSLSLPQHNRLETALSTINSFLWRLEVQAALRKKTIATLNFKVLVRAHLGLQLGRYKFWHPSTAPCYAAKSANGVLITCCGCKDLLCTQSKILALKPAESDPFKWYSNSGVKTDSEDVSLCLLTTCQMPLEMY